MAFFYRHYKNRYYQFIGEALDTQDDSLVVVYRTLYPSEYSLFTRPKEAFFGTVTHDGITELRFTPVSFDDLPPEAQHAVAGGGSGEKEKEKGNASRQAGGRAAPQTPA